MQHVLNKRSSASQAHPRAQGQGMTEYIIIVAIIAIGAVTASSFFGARVQAQFIAMGAEISGEDGDQTGAITKPEAKQVNLGTYNQ